MYNKVDELVCYFVHVQQKMYIHLIKHHNVQKHEQLKCTSKCTIKGVHVQMYCKYLLYVGVFLYMYNKICTSHTNDAKCTQKTNVQKLLYIFPEFRTHFVCMYIKYLCFFVHAQFFMYISKYLIQHWRRARCDTKISELDSEYILNIFGKLHWLVQKKNC